MALGKLYCDSFHSHHCTHLSNRNPQNWCTQHILTAQLIACASLPFQVQTQDQRAIVQRRFEEALTSYASSDPSGFHLPHASMSHRHIVALLMKVTGRQLHGHTSSVNAVAFFPDGRHIISGSDDQSIRIWRVNTGTVVTVLPATKSGSGLSSIACSPDGLRIAYSSDASDICVRHVTNQQTLLCRGHTDQVSSVTFSPDGTLIASASFDKTIRTWDTETGVTQMVFAGYKSLQLQSVAFSPDGSQIASGSDEGLVRVWDTKTGQRLSTLYGPADGVTSVAFSPTGTQIVSGYQDNTIRIWKLKTRRQIALRGHVESVVSVAVSPDGQHLVSGSLDGSVRIWDVKTRQSIVLKEHGDPVRSVAFSPNGMCVASGSMDKSIRIWNLRMLKSLW
jgi:uncharacterized protein with WD repeat